MHINEEAGRAVDRGRVSEVILWRDGYEVSENHIVRNQTAWITARFAVSAARARVLAEHAFGLGGAA